MNKHVLKNWFKRNIDFNYIEECLCNKIPLSISKTMENRFKLIYPHPTNNNEDLYIIIQISDYHEIEIITIYSFDIKRREREYEPK